MAASDPAQLAAPRRRSRPPGVPDLADRAIFASMSIDQRRATPLRSTAYWPRVGSPQPPDATDGSPVIDVNLSGAAACRGPGSTGRRARTHDDRGAAAPGGWVSDASGGFDRLGYNGLRT
jgi:hypothetical protein